MGMLDKLNEFSSDNQEWVTFRADNELEIERKMGMQRVLKEGREEERKKIIENMLANDMDLETICKLTGLSLEEVNSLKS